MADQHNNAFKRKAAFKAIPPGAVKGWAVASSTGPTQDRYECRFSGVYILKEKTGMTTQPKPPSHLSKKAQTFFKNFVAEWEVDQSAIEVLTRVCESQDRADQAAEELKKAGSLTTLDRFGVAKAHPMVSVERQARAAIVDGLKALGVLKQTKDDGDRYSKKVF